MKFFLIALALIAQSAFATDCTPMNLITEEKSPFAKIPVYDQDGIGICYAYVAAQLVDYHMVKNGNERSVHPLWAALKYAESIKQDKISSGITFNAIEEMIKAGNCRYDTISSAIKVWADKANVQDVDVMDLIEKFAPKIKNLYDTKRKTDPTAEPTAEEIDLVINEAIEAHRPWCSPGATWEALMPELRNLSVLSSRKILTDLVLPVCGSNLQKLNIPKPKYFTTEVDTEWGPTIERKLNTLKAPISVSYCSKVLYEPDFDGIERKTPTQASKNADNCGGHESLIVGKKKVGNSCQFLLRNSWGNGFSSSTEKWKCLCKNRETGAMVDDCSNDTHNNGKFTVEGCWIDGSKLSKNIFGMTSLENPAPAKPGAKKK